MDCDLTKDFVDYKLLLNKVVSVKECVTNLSSNTNAVNVKN